MDIIATSTTTRTRGRDPFSTTIRRLIAWAIVLAVGVVGTDAAAQTTYTVTNTSDSGPGSLRAAINNANDGSGTPADIVAFDIAGSGPHVIQPQTDLPILNDPVRIDGTTEPDYAGTPVVVIDGGPSNLATGFRISGGFSEVRGLAIINITGGGSVFTRSISIFTGGLNLIESCYIGVQPDGTTAAGNGGLGGGISITNGSTQNVIRGNVIADMNQSAIALETIENEIVGNVIGATADGRTGLNGGNGVGVVVRASFNVIGGTSSAERNLFADLGTGIRVQSSQGTVIQGNFIGTNAFDDDLGISGTGIYLTDAAEFNVIGYDYAAFISSSQDQANVIAYNTRGIWMDDTAADGNAARGNVMYQNTNLGIDLGALGATANDDAGADSDEGANRLQNFPEISDAFYDGTEVTVEYSVPTDPSNAAYPLDVDFYAADADDEEGRTYLFTDRYAEVNYTGGPIKFVAATVSSSIVSQSDDLIAIATDADGNTSEFTVSSVRLPVELATLRATADGPEVTVQWATATETGNAGFHVERLHGDEEPVTLGFVDGAGTTTQPQRYRFTDRMVPFAARTLRYRLRQVDVDGTETVSRAVTVRREAPTELRVQEVSPHPVRGTATVRYALPKAAEGTDIEARVYNLLGQQVAVLQGQQRSADGGQLRFDTTGWASGTYFLRVTAGSHVVTRRIVVVQ